MFPVKKSPSIQITDFLHQSYQTSHHLTSLTSPNINQSMVQAVQEGQRLEDMRDEAATEVFRACRALLR
jgi:hypothetical protein